MTYVDSGGNLVEKLSQFYRSRVSTRFAWRVMERFQKATNPSSIIEWTLFPQWDYPEHGQSNASGQSHLL